LTRRARLLDNDRRADRRPGHPLGLRIRVLRRSRRDRLGQPPGRARVVRVDATPRISERYVAQGGNLRAFVSLVLAGMDHEHVVGAHVNS
jgi:hypothetical protein